MRRLRWWTGSERVDMGLGGPQAGLGERIDWARCRLVEALRQAQGERWGVRGTLGASQGERWRVLRSVATTRTVQAEPVEAPPRTPLERAPSLRAITP